MFRMDSHQEPTVQHMGKKLKSKIKSQLHKMDRVKLTDLPNKTWPLRAES